MLPTAIFGQVSHGLLGAVGEPLEPAARWREAPEVGGTDQFAALHLAHTRQMTPVVRTPRLVRMHDTGHVPPNDQVVVLKRHRNDRSDEDVIGTNQGMPRSHGLRFSR
jgi:hypothetical protein